MKKLLICITVFISSLTFANEITYDYIILQNGKYIQGQVVDIGTNKIKMKVGADIKIIKNKDILSLTFDQELTSKEKYSLGFLDGKRYERNQMENLIYPHNLIALGLYLYELMLKDDFRKNHNPNKK